MMVEYRVGWYRYVREWVCPEHTGWARSKFVKWWLERCALPPPTSAAEAVHLAKDGALAPTQRITVRSSANARFDRIIGYQLGPIPDYCPEPGWNDAADEPEPEPLAMAAADDFVPF